MKTDIFAFSMLIAVSSCLFRSSLRRRALGERISDANMILQVNVHTTCSHIPRLFLPFRSRLTAENSFLPAMTPAYASGLSRSGHARKRSHPIDLCAEKAFVPWCGARTVDGLLVVVEMER